MGIFTTIPERISLYYKTSFKKITEKNQAIKKKRKPINFADTFYFDGSILFFEGELHPDLAQKDLNIVIKLRKKNTYYTIPIEKMSGNRWKASLNINSDKFVFKIGTWDFYIQDLESGKKYRVRVSNDNIFEKRDTFFSKTEKSSRCITLYVTIEKGLSFKSRTGTVKFELTNIKKSGWIIKVKGKLFFEDQVLLSNIDDLIIAFRQRNTGDLKRYPIHFIKEIDNNFINFSFIIDYQQFIPQKNMETLRWDVYLQTKIDGEYHRFRLKSDSEEGLSISRVEFECSELYQVYLYLTKYNNLSLALTPLKLMRDVFYYAIKNDTLWLKGYAYVNTTNFSNDVIQRRRIVVRERVTEKEKTFPINEIFYEKDKSLDDDEILKKHSHFQIGIPLHEIIDLIQDEKTILDLYVRISFRGYVYERKLGCETYKYYKDHALDTGLVKQNGFYYRHFLTFTPRGNIKIEITRYTKKNYNYIKYGQYIDWIKNINKDVWLIGERPDTAQDTGYHFFKYCRENYPEKEIYYVIDKNSKDLKNIEKLGNILFLGSEEHLKKAAIAKVFIGSHDLEYFLPTKPFELYSYKRGLKVFLQHGVLGRKNVEYYKKFYKYPFHLFCVSSELEKQMVMDKMGYSNKEVKITGLSRFDNLFHQPGNKRSILLIPTWREWINNKEVFLESEYFNRYKGLLTNKRLHSLLKKYDVQLNFYPHYRMQQFIEYFGDLRNKYINVVQLGEKPVQKLLLESSLMITDYSSVSFDFNYMSKPIIFYHFDQDRFFANGILRPIEETFLGDICKTEDEIVDAIEYYLKKDFKEKTEVAQKKYLIFDHIDQENCSRIYDEIIKYV